MSNARSEGRLKMTLKTLIALCIISFAFSLPANAKKKSSIETEVLTIEYDKRANKTQTKKKSKTIAEENVELSNCKFNILPFNDARQNKLTIGTNYSKALLVQGVDKWLEDASNDLVLKKLKASAANAKEITVRPSLTRLYSYSEGMNILGVSAIKVHFYYDDKLIDTRRYRGFGSTLNWANGDSEFLDAADESISKALPKLTKDLDNICNSLS